ncbi:MAG TPA: DISARM system SNF2-like helicase DrmD, partial [Polyangia bacterium]
HGAADEPSPQSRASRSSDPYAPQQGAIVQVRQRQYLVEDVVPPPAPGQHTRVDLVCLDDDNQGRRLSVLWEVELGARVLHPETHGLGDATKLDPPRHFAAYLHALKWHAVTATDAKLFQAPFRAGIKLMNHQLTPLKKALELPRSNLFIADDVGLGKTIEAGLILQELLLRQRVDFALIVCPASVALQWRDEMKKRFGLLFELYNRVFIGRRRQERGFGVNPWSTHNRFIITYQTLRRPEYRDPLLQHIGERIRKSLLILDEAHTAAPASASKYAIDSRVTRVVRDVAPRFENRLFLSATPHNGHSNSFSALLEILDPQRFTRGVPVRGLRQLEPVMVRRLKTDLRELGVDEFPERKVVQIDLRHEGNDWRARLHGDALTAIGHGRAPELELGRMLQEYSRLMRPQKGRGQLVFINLQKRLLSSIEAFTRTLRLHEKSVGAGTAHTALQLTLDEAGDGDEYGLEDEALEDAAAADVVASSAEVQRPEGRARQLLADMIRLAEEYRGAPDAKTMALLEWIRQHQCPAVKLGGADGRKAEWTDRRVLIFTEYGDTKRYLWQVLSTAVQGTTEADARIMQFHGGMSDEQREEVQLAFNSEPDQHPLRILIATDAAREGVNLQGHCADLFHYDVPWNPARMEQRNGRIDRTLQPAPQVRCHYFFYPQRVEDQVLQTLVGKVETIQRELGSLGSVIMDRFADVLEEGIGEQTVLRLDEAEAIAGRREVVRGELEAQRDNLPGLRVEIDEAGRILNRSRQAMDFAPELLRDAINVGMELAGASSLQPAARESKDGTARQAFLLPELSASWAETLDTLRPPRGRDEPFWDWRKRPPQPVVFFPPERINSGLVHLHLQHPLVQRVLSRFRAQGYSAHDLGRVTVVKTARDSLARVIAFGRLSLFGPGATRLHDEVISVAAPWLESGGAKHLKPFADDADRRALETLEEVLRDCPDLTVGAKVQQRLLASAPSDYAALWRHIDDEADARAHAARQRLSDRAHVEADALRVILAEQRRAILDVIQGRVQLGFDFGEHDQDQRRQFEDDRKHMEQRLTAIEKEIDTEPAQIKDVYRVVLQRLEPVGLIYLWPESRG